jgi:tetratricopeptide (TPR) repeat protein
MAAYVSPPLRILNHFVSLRCIVLLLLLIGTAPHVGSAQAADLATWRHCMQLADPALSSTACSQIIDAAKETPDNLAYAYLYRARTDAYCSRRDPAASDFKDALKRDPTLVHAWYGLGELAMAKEDYSGAVEAFTKAIEANGEDADIGRFAADSPGLFRYEPLRARGFARYKQDDLTQALADYDAAIKACPTCSEPYRNRGVVFARQHQLDKAFADFNHAIALNPRAPQGFFIRGFVQTRMQKFADAIVNFSEALRVHPNGHASLRARADAYAKLGKTKEADEDRKRADAVEAESKDDRRASCGKGGPESSAEDTEAEADASAPSATTTEAGMLDGAALTALVSGKKWRTQQGLWSVDLEFRRDHTFRQHSRDDTQGGKLQLTADGAWFVGRDQLCLYTNFNLCLGARRANGVVTFTRGDGTIEFTGLEAKFQAISLDNSSAPIAEYPLDEQFHAAPPGAAKGPKTLLYNLERVAEPPKTDKWVEEYLITQLRDAEGWDVVDADVPHSLDAQYMVRGTASGFAAAAHVARRIKEFKVKGYQRIFVSGQFVGGWAALALSTQPKLPLDGVLLFSPLCCAPRLSDETDAPTKDFINNKLYFEQLIAHDAYPTAAILFNGDEWDPGGRGEITGEALKRNNVASLLINKPEGFSGENSMWLPMFDLLYRDCIVAFLGAPKSMQCAQRPLAKADFRAIFTARQLPDMRFRLVDPTTLVGRKFASYPTPQTYTIVSPTSTVLISHEAGERTIASSFRDGRYCLRQRVRYQWPVDTDEHCYVIVKWSDSEMLLFDEKGKAVSQWWVEKHD